jgi:hypothetical protein
MLFCEFQPENITSKNLLMEKSVFIRPFYDSAAGHLQLIYYKSGPGYCPKGKEILLFSCHLPTT